MSDKTSATSAARVTSSHKSQEDRDFRVDLLGTLDRRKSLILASTIIGLLVGGCYWLFMPAKYESRAQLLLMQNDSANMASNMTPTENSVSEDLLATHMSLLQSVKLVSSALANNNLAELPSIQKRLKADVSAADYIIDNLYVTRGGEGAARGARILTVAFRHFDPKDSKLVAEAIMGEYKAFVTTKFKDINLEAIELINKARLDLEKQIADQMKAYRDFRSTAPILASAEGGSNIYKVRYEELAAELSQLMLTIDEAAGRIQLVRDGLKRLENTDGPELQKLALVDERNAERLGILVTVERGKAETAAFQALQPERMAGAQTEYSSLLMLKAKLQQAIQDFGAKHPEVRTLETQIAEMERFFAKRSSFLNVGEDQKPLTPDDVMKSYLNLLENDLVGMRQKKSDYEKQLGEAEKAAKELIGFELEELEMTRQIDRQEELYNSVVERLRDINMQQDTSSLIQEVIEEPVLGEKVSPNLPVAAAIALFTSLLLAAAAVLISELSDKKIHSAEDLESIYGSNIIGHIPEFEKNLAIRTSMRKVAKTRPTISPSLMVYHDPQSTLAEIFRGMRTQLLFTLRDTKRVLAVTGPRLGDGKSTVNANLAISLASTGKTVLLIDCDMRRPNVHRLFGVSNKAGLVDALTSEVPFQDILQESGCGGLTLLTSGNPPENPAELLGSEAFQELVAVAREKFDYIFLDCPPLLAVADPSIVAAIADCMILVTSLTPDGFPQAKQCSRVLTSIDAPLIGIVVNKVEAKTSDYTYGGGYQVGNYGYEYQQGVAS